MSVPEQRYRDNTGERHLATSNKIRCHALSKAKVRKWREEFNDYEISSSELWPECQCNKGAVEGQFTCRWHGGKTPRTVNPPRTLVDTLPVDLAEKYRTLAAHPDYISRKEDILLIQTRQWQLVERLGELTGSEEAWATVLDGLLEIKSGNNINGISLIEQALQSAQNEKDIWKEIRSNDGILKDLTNTQVKTAKELRLMATTEQVTALMDNILTAILSGAEKYIEDERKRSDFLNTLSYQIRGFINFGPEHVIEQVGSGSREGN